MLRQFKLQLEITLIAGVELVLIIQFSATRGTGVVLSTADLSTLSIFEWGALVPALMQTCLMILRL